jgi:hypothetical protein
MAEEREKRRLQALENEQQHFEEMRQMQEQMQRRRELRESRRRVRTEFIFVPTMCSAGLCCMLN